MDELYYRAYDNEFHTHIRRGSDNKVMISVWGNDEGDYVHTNIDDAVILLNTEMRHYQQRIAELVNQNERYKARLAELEADLQLFKKGAAVEQEESVKWKQANESQRYLIDLWMPIMNWSQIFVPRDFQPLENETHAAYFIRYCEYLKANNNPNQRIPDRPLQEIDGTWTAKTDEVE